MLSQPTRILPQDVPALQAASEIDPKAQADGEPWTVNIASREEARQFYRAIYGASEDVNIEWTGDTATGNAGTTSAAFKEAVRNRINFFRAYVGVPANVSINSTFSDKAQQAALIMSANNSLSHTPPSSWIHFSADGSEAAGKSNLDLSSFGPRSIDRYIQDSGASNDVVGHRRWVLYPQTLEMGTGDVPAQGSNKATNALWVQDAEIFKARPTTRDEFVAWPAPGFTPYQLVWPRWSISVAKADFTNATVTMTRNGSPIATVIETRGSSNQIPEATLVWLYDGKTGTEVGTHDRPSGDMTYAVTVNNVSVNGGTQNYTYSVTVFDPDVSGTDFVESTPTGTASPGTNGPSTYTATTPSFGSGFYWRELSLASDSTTYGAEGDLEGLIDGTSASYTPRVSSPTASGNGAYHLAIPDFTNQSLTLPHTYFVPTTGNPALTYASRFGVATPSQVTRVQISINGGSSWTTVREQAGNGSSTDSSFQSRNDSLTAFAGKTINVRFLYEFTGGSAFNQTDPNVGWLIDDINLNGVQIATVLKQSDHSAGSTFDYTASSTGGKGLQVTGAFFGNYLMEWGSVLSVTANGGLGSGGSGGGGTSTDTSRIVNMSVRSVSGTGADALSVGMVVGGAGSKNLLIRVVGPTLGQLGVQGVIADPRLQLLRSVNGNNQAVTDTDNWNGDSTLTSLFSTLGAFPLTSNLDAAIAISLDTAVYNAVVDTKGGSGVVLVEGYDTEAVTSGTARLVNVSARSQVGTGGDVLVAGFVISGTGNKTLLIRGVGASLGDFGVPGVLANPQLIVRNSNTSAVVADNDNWNNDASIASTAQTLGAFPLSSTADAALLVTLAPGVYTATVSGVSNTTGIALVEVYEVN